MSKLLHLELSDKILNAFYDVYNKIGFGFEKCVYVNAINIKLKMLQLKFEISPIIEILK